MKKQSLLLFGGALLALASCQSENTTSTGGFSQEQVDSIVNARIAEKMTALQASNDSTINALAIIKADSIIAASKGATATAKPATTSKTTTTTVKTPSNTTKKNDPGAVTTRPGADKKGEVKPVNDRPGADKKGEVKPVTDRPGAN